MAKQHNTMYTGNQEASIFHRVLGKCCYYTDLDQVEDQEGSAENMCLSFTYEKGNPKPVAIIDWKYPGHSLSTQPAAVQLRLMIANKLEVPFFFAVTFLDDNFPVKCFFVIPINDFAKKYFKRCELDIGGHWFSLRSFSKLQHALRGQTWNKDEVLLDKNLLAAGLPVGTRLQDLSNQLQHYTLPLMEI